MIILADNDIIYKLACFDLLQEFLTCLEAAPQDIYVLSTLKYKLRKKLKNDPIPLKRLEEFVAVISEVPQASAQSLERFVGLDVGEQQLFAVMIEYADTSQLVTGDKRALQAVAELAVTDQALLHILSGRVECFEGVLLGLIQRYGFEVINAKISAYPNADGLCRMAFGINRTQEHAEEAIRSYLESIRSEAVFVKSS
jgi:hypothetical protein